MSQTTPAASPQLEGSMFLFTKPALLTKESHASLGVSRPERPFAYAEKIRAVPLTLSEIAAASRHFPVIFADASNPLPLAVVGLIDDQNLFVDEAGEWAEGIYIPGYLRRYPFALANDKQSDADNPRMAMIVDEGYEGIKDGGDLPFFTDGEPSEAMKQAMEYCQNYERDRLTTVRFAEEMKKFDVLASQVAQFTPDGAAEAQPFAQYVGVEEKKLQDMDQAKFLELRTNNILPLLYAQLMSMGNWRVLMERRARRLGLEGADVMKPSA